MEARPGARLALLLAAPESRRRAPQPNPAHLALAELERRLGERYFLCTQNVDDLHERAGSHNLVHMHGELFQSRCDRCEREPFPDTRLYESRAEHRRCECGGRIRPNIVWFGEVPFHMERIFEELHRCTVMLVVGTSGVVQPAASFVHWASERHGGGARAHLLRWAGASGQRRGVHPGLRGQGRRGAAGTLACALTRGHCSEFPGRIHCGVGADCVEPWLPAAILPAYCLATPQILVDLGMHGERQSVFPPRLAGSFKC